MKKLFLAILGILIATSVCFTTNVFASADNKTIISSTTLNADPTSVTSSAFNIQDYKKVAFFVSYDETEVGETLSAAVTFDISYDGTNWITGASFHDYAGGATLQTSQTISADGWYYCWFDPDLTIPYVRMVITATGTDADDIIVVIGYMVGIK